MKRIVSLLVAITLNFLTMNMFAVSKDSEDHTLVSLWKTYYAAERADKPKDQLAALDAIKAEARKRHLAWDFYDACEKYYSTRLRISWKENEDALNQRRSEITQFGEPVAVVFAGYESDTEKQWEYVCSNKARLQASHNPEFYKRDFIRELVFGEALVPLLRDDYEYALWCLWARGCKSADVEGRYAGEYPYAAFAEYRKLTVNGDATDEALERYASGYAGKAAALLARQELIARRRSDLDDRTATEADYLALKALCEKFIGDCKAFTGIEKTIADCCRQPESILARLNEKYVSGKVEDGVLNVYFKNLPSTGVQISRDGAAVWERQVTNPVRRYCVKDTVRVPLPVLDDGSYMVRIGSGKQLESFPYDKYTLAVTTREESRGIGVAVVDFRTGEPLGSCDLVLCEDSGKVLCTVRGFALDGFTLLPEKMASVIAGRKNNRRSLILRAETGNGARRSDSHRMQTSYMPKAVPENNAERNCMLIVDRTAFRPGETVHYKAVLYDGYTAHKPCAPGTKVKMTLKDVDGSEIASKTLQTNEFGSVAGSFVLEPCGKGGLYTLSAVCGSQVLADRMLRVDEFVLPTYGLVWDEPERFYLAGDRVRISGTVRSYSGHSLSNASLSYTLRSNGEAVSGVLKPDADGRFAIETVAQKYGNPVQCTVKVTDGTGETLEFSHMVWVEYDLELDVKVTNKDKGQFSVWSDSRSQEYMDTYSLSGDVAKVRISANGALPYPTLKLSWTLEDSAGNVRSSGNASQGEEIAVDLAGLPSGEYLLKAYAGLVTDSGTGASDESTVRILKLGRSDSALPFRTKSFFRELPGDEVALQVGLTEGTAWVFAEVFGEGCVLLDRKLVRIDGKPGAPGSLQTISFERRPGWSEDVQMSVLFIKDGQRYSYDRMFHAPVSNSELPLAFSRFLDRTLPGTQYTFSIHTAAGVECAAAIFDASTENISPNAWYTFRPASETFRSVRYYCTPGRDGSSGGVMYERVATKTSGMGAVMMANSAADIVEEVVEDESIPFQLVEGGSMPGVRENFAPTVAWEPFLRSDDEGRIDLKFTNADKLSTYIVQLFAHDRQCRNNVLRRSMVVTLPVKVALVQPQFLYSGDSYRTRVSLANSSGTDVQGTLSVSYIDGRDRGGRVIRTESGSVTVPAGAAADWQCGIDVPEGIDDLGILVKFVAEDAGSGSDAMFVSVPVLRPVQTLSEAHSAVLLPGDDALALEESLRSMFVNVPGASAQRRDVSIRIMLAEALRESSAPKGDDILSQSASLLSGMIASSLGASGLSAALQDGIVAKIKACHNPDGGFGWFEGMRSSPVVTAVVLERLARISGFAELFGEDELASAALYLDRKQFSDEPKQYWCGDISLEQYLHVRALYASVPFEAPSGKALKEFRKAVRAYLTPSGARGLSGQILAKARRIRTLSLLLGSAGGEALASAWGVGLGGRLSKSLNADLESLLQYAVDHRSGGCYFPNAVLPWRGLLESEAYAHALLADLLADFDHADKADGVRMWLMLQKETQQWTGDPAYAEALCSVFHASDRTLSTKVMSLSASDVLPFDVIRPSGNGFTVDAEYLLGDKPLQAGDTVRIGDRITAKYNIWNEENRSFVKLTAARSAALRPVEQLSGQYGWKFRPLAVEASFVMTPQGYRSVLSERTEYYFDVYPEEKTTVTEDFFVTQEGAFCAPAVTIESMYAPHYRANGSAPDRLLVAP